MFDFEDIKNDIITQNNNLENTLALNSFNPIVIFFNFYGEYLPYIKEETNYNDLIPGGIYKLDVVDFDNTKELGVERYTITPHRLDYMCYKFAENNKLFKSVNFKSNDITEFDNTYNILYKEIFSKYTNNFIVNAKYFDLFALYIIYFKGRNITPIIYLSYRPDIEITELLPYIYKIYDLTSYSEIKNKINSCNFDYYNSYYKYICKPVKMQSEQSQIFNNIRRGNIVYFKYNDEHYFIKTYPEINSFNDVLLFDFRIELHYKENDYTSVYTINNEDLFSNMKFMYVTSPCELPEFSQYISRCKLSFSSDSHTIVKVKLEK